MRLHFTYIFETPNGTQLISETPEAAINEFNEYRDGLQQLVDELNRENPDKPRATVDSYLDLTRKYSPEGSITLFHNGKHEFYELTTEIREID